MGPIEARFELSMPPEEEAGHYASFANIWHDQDGFIFDFAVVSAPPRPETDETTGQRYAAIAARVVSRVRIPPSQAFEFMKGLNTQLAAWEAEHAGTGEPG